MTTLAHQRLPQSAARRFLLVRDRPGSTAFVLSALLALDAATASLASLLVPDVIRGPAVGVGSLQGTALVILVVALPVLLVSMVLTARGSVRGAIGWFGALSYIAYQGVLFLFASPFNQLFFLYLGILSLGIWSLLALLVRFPIDELTARISSRMPVRALAIYLLVTAGMFLVPWLRAVVPAVLTSEPPAFLEGTGMTTGPGQILDLGFTLPLMALTAAWLWQRRPWGYLLTGGLLVMLAIETISIGSDQWFGHAADPASPVASAELVPVFAVLTLIGLVALFFFARHVTEEASR